MLETLVPQRVGGALHALATGSAPAATPALVALAAGAALLLLVLRAYRKAYDRPEGFPPGPPRLPIWGSYWFFLWEDYNNLYKSLLAMTRKYKSKIVGFYLGEFPCVGLSDYEDIKEMQSRSDLIGRADVIVARERSAGSRDGILFNDGPAWMELRRFVLRHIRDFGWGRRFASSEDIMHQELRDAMDLLRGEWKDEEVVRDGKVYISHMFAPFGMNAMWAMFGGERLPRGHHAPFRVAHRHVHAFFRSVEPSGNAVSMTPWLRFLTPGRFGLQSVADSTAPLRDFVRNAIREHRDSLEEGHEARDLIDKFLLRMNELNGENKDVFSDDQLVLTGVDMLTAASGALASSVAFLWQQLLHHPEVQARVQQEIDSVVGRHRLITLDDRQNMPYSEATVRESMRRITLAPLSVPHVALEDTTIRGYTIPKGTILFPNLHAIHMDPEIWGDPENFRPDRFLEKDGSLKKRDMSFPFGGGKRLCLGETFSRQMIFLFLTHVLQNFTLEADGTLPPMDHVLSGFAVVPDDLWARIVPRP